MSEGKQGCRVELIMNVYDENGELISDIPKGSWFGMDRSMANVAARSLIRAVVDCVEQWDVAAGRVNSKPAVK